MFDPAHIQSATLLLGQFVDRLLAIGIPLPSSDREFLIQRAAESFGLTEEPDLMPYSYSVAMHIHHGVLDFGLHPSRLNVPEARVVRNTHFAEFAFMPVPGRPGDGWISGMFLEPNLLPPHREEHPEWFAQLDPEDEVPGLMALHRATLHLCDMLATHARSLPEAGDRFVFMRGWRRRSPYSTHQGFLWPAGDPEPDQRLVTEVGISTSLRVKVQGDDLWHEIALLDDDVHLNASEFLGRSYASALRVFHERDVAAIRRSV